MTGHHHKISPFTPRDNTEVYTLEDAQEETKRRVKFLAKLNKSKPPSSPVNAELREVVWRIQKSYFEWRHWRRYIAVVLNDEGYPEVAMTLMKQIVKMFNSNDEGLYKLSRNVFGSAANYSDYIPFGQNLAKFGAIEVVLGFLAAEIKQSHLPYENPGGNFLTKSSLQLLLNLLKTPAFADEMVKHGAMEVFPTLISGQDEEVKCLAALCHLNMLNNTQPHDGYKDDRNVGFVFLKAINAWMNSHDERNEVRVSIEAIEALIDGLSQLASYETNKESLCKLGVIQTLNRIFEITSQDTIQFKSVNLAVELFSPPVPELARLSDETSKLLVSLETMEMLAREGKKSRNLPEAIRLLEPYRKVDDDAEQKNHAEIITKVATDETLKGQATEVATEAPVNPENIDTPIKSPSPKPLQTDEIEQVVKEPSVLQQSGEGENLVPKSPIPETLQITDLEPLKSATPEMEVGEDQKVAVTAEIEVTDNVRSPEATEKIPAPETAVEVKVQEHFQSSKIDEAEATQKSKSPSPQPPVEEEKAALKTPEPPTVIETKADEPNNEEGNWRQDLGRFSFKENHELLTIDDAKEEMQLRVKFLDKLAKLAPDGVIQDESVKGIQLIVANNYPNWHEWQTELMNVAWEENFPDVILPYLKEITVEYLNHNEVEAATLLIGIYSHLSSMFEDNLYIFTSGPDFMSFAFLFLEKISPVTESGESSTADAIVAECINCLNNLSQIEELSAVMYDLGGVQALEYYCESPIHGFVVNRLIARIVSAHKKADARKLSEETHAQHDSERLGVGDERQPWHDSNDSFNSGEMRRGLQQNGPVSSLSAPILQISSLPIEQWSSEEIQQWLTGENLQQHFGSKMLEFEGERLAKLLEIEKKAPEFFYNAVSKHFHDSPLPLLLDLFAALTRLSDYQYQQFTNKRF